MRTILKIILFFSVSVLFAGGPGKSVYIKNLTGEDIFFTIVYQGQGHGMHYLVNQRNILSPNEYDPFPDKMILHFVGEEGDITELIHYSVYEIKIYNKAGVLIKTLDGRDMVKSSMPFIYDTNYRGSGVEDYPGELDWTGSYYYSIIKSDLKKTNGLFSHRTTERLNLREHDHISSTVKRVLNKGERLTALQVGDVYEFGNTSADLRYWIKVKTADGLVGWCVSTYLEPY